ncbi:MAG: hypothetical protein ABI716_02345 [Candidatus Saccharibacteria bacterium]
MKKIFMIPAVIGLLGVPSFALAHGGGGSDDNGATTTGHNQTTSPKSADVRHDDKVVIPATPAVPATPGHDNDADDDSATIPATPAVPAHPRTVDNDDDDVTGQVEAEAATSIDDSGHHAAVAADVNSRRGSNHVED